MRRDRQKDRQTGRQTGKQAGTSGKHDSISKVLITLKEVKTKILKSDRDIIVLQSCASTARKVWILKVFIVPGVNSQGEGGIASWDMILLPRFGTLAMIF